MAESKPDEKTLLDNIKSHFESLKTKRSIFEAEWKDICVYIGSKILDWEETKEEITRPRRHTGRPSEYLSKLVSGLMGYTISPNVTWLKLTLTDTSLLEYDGIKDWLEKTEKALYEEFNRNNLYSEAPAFISNAAQFGHGVMLIDNKEDKAVRFMTIAEPEVYIACNEWGDIDTVFRCFSLTVKNLVARFGEEQVHENVRKDFKDVKGKNKEVKILHAVFPRENYDAEKLDDKNMAFASYYIDLNNNTLLEESGYYELPYSVFIWEKITGSAYGDSPARQAIPDMRLLNKVEESRIKLAQLQAEPPMNVPESMRGMESVVPAGFNYYTTANEIMTPINIGGNYAITLDAIRDIESRIKDKFHVDFMLMLQAQTAQKTATEVVELQGEKAALLSSLIVNQNKALAEMVRRTYSIMYRQDRIPEIPQILMTSGAALNIDFVGPLAQAQKRYHQTGGVQTSLALAQPVIHMNPESLDYINTDALLKNVLDSNGFPQEALREESEVQAIRQQRAQAQMQAIQEQMQMKEQEQLMSNYDKLNEPVKDGSAIQALSKQLQGGLNEQQQGS